MSTNYLATSWLGTKIKHIGKSSMGHPFALRIYPEEGITTLSDWKSFLKQRKIFVRDEYGQEITLDDLYDRIGADYTTHEYEFS